MTRINIHHIARIEGHGNVEIKLNKGKIEDIKLVTVEPARFFEAIVGGRHYDDIALIVSRICGICSPNHTVTGLLAVEDALGIEVSRRTQLLRQLLVYGSFIQNHTTHLYFLSAPDYFKTSSIFPLAEESPKLLQQALELKRLGNDLCAAVGGRPVHPVNAVVGGFSSEPDPMTLQVLAARLRATLNNAIQTVEIFAKFDIPDFHPMREKLALHAPNTYTILADSPEVKITALNSVRQFEPSDYHSYIKEHLQPERGNAKFSLLEAKEDDGAGIPYMVGALARINMNWDALMPVAASAAKAAMKAGFRQDADNPYFNNLCQAIELVDALQRCAALCDELALNYLEQQGVIASPKEINTVEAVGKAASEAPRGTLFYSIGLDKEGRVSSGDVITPTAQNLACIEADLRMLAPQLNDLPQEEMIMRIEQLIRAYDPCLSCAVH